MNSPTHLIAGAVAAQIAMVAIGKHPSRIVQIAGGLGCFILAVGSHVGLDLIPHYNWIIYVPWLKEWPYSWLLRQAIFSLPILLLALYCGRDHPVLNFFGLFGSMYPDLEKVAFLDFHLPERFVMLPWHSLRCTSTDPRVSIPTLITVEMVIFVALAAGTLALSLKRQRTPLPVAVDAPQFA